MFTLAYISNPAVDYDDARLSLLLDRARAFNREHDITGALLFDGTTFAQVLEAPKAQIELLKGKIYEDPTHHNIITLMERDLDRRTFGTWDMAYSRITDTEQLQGAADRWSANLDALAGPEGDREGVAFIREFWKFFVQSRD